MLKVAWKWTPTWLLGIWSHFLLYLSQGTCEHYLYKVFCFFSTGNGQQFCNFKFYINTTYLMFVIFFVVFEIFDYRFKMFYIFVCGRGDRIQGVHNQTINLTL